MNDALMRVEQEREFDRKEWLYAAIDEYGAEPYCDGGWMAASQDGATVRVDYPACTMTISGRECTGRAHTEWLVECAACTPCPLRKEGELPDVYGATVTRIALEEG